MRFDFHRWIGFRPVRARLKTLLEGLRSAPSYRPERNYMRGPGEACKRAGK